jgi:Rv2525c-like, glycoside hydrolase-like domain/Putative peptidoglycan binding domain
MRRLAAALLTLALGVPLLVTGVPTASADESALRRANVLTPGDFTGYGFDQCLAPTQASMDAWLKKSPFLAAGIYISGDSRACRNQPNLTPTWISTQLANGWRLLPIALGPQASCQPRFPRYKDDFTISPKPADAYATARAQGVVEADKNAADAAALGISPGSTIWYDLEAFNLKDTDCRESALTFVSGWVTRTKELGYVAGFYSSASSGIKMLDDARLTRPGVFALPDRIWIARWDGVANTSTTYIGEDGWRPGGRMKQFQGGHNETWGGVTINIDSNYIDLGAGSQPTTDSHCGGLKVGYWQYPALTTTAAKGSRVKVLQCLLTEKGLYSGAISGTYDAATVAAAGTWQTSNKFAASSTFSTSHWTSFLAGGTTPVLKVGSTGEAVHRLQRALNAAGAGRLKSSGLFEGNTEAAVRLYQARLGMPSTGVVNPTTWKKLLKGKV